MKFIYFFIMLSLIVFHPVKAANESYIFDWKLLKTEDNIRLYTSNVDGSAYKAVKAEMPLKTSLQNFVALTQDAAACPKWAHLCERSSIQQRESHDTYLIYTINDMPWPIMDREVLVKMMWEQNPETLEVSINSYALPTSLPTNDKAIQITQAVSNWYALPRDQHTITVISEAHVEHEKNIPAWAANSSMVESSLQTFRNLRHLMQNQGYIPPHIDFQVKDMDGR